MRVGVDGRSLVGGEGRGVAHYTAALLGALAAGHPEDAWVVLLPRGPVGPLPGGLEIVRSPWPGRALHGSAAAVRRPRLDRLLGGPIDVCWAPAPAPLALSRGMPLVLSVHDRSWEARPHDFTRYERLWHRLARPRALARRAAGVLTLTELGRAELIASWGLAPGRVHVVAPAAAVRCAEARTPAASAPVSYVLFVGALEPRKAPDVLAAAFAAARGQGLEAELWFAGEGRLAASLDGPGVRRLGHVGDDELAALYRGALALALPSRLEGFGLPVLEALEAGTPIIAGDIGVLRESLSGDGALFVAPGDIGALAAALLRVEREPALRAMLVAAGRRAAGRFSWEASAHAAHAVLAGAASGP